VNRVLDINNDSDDKVIPVGPAGPPVGPAVAVVAAVAGAVVAIAVDVPSLVAAACTPPVGEGTLVAESSDCGLLERVRAGLQIGQVVQTLIIEKKNQLTSCISHVCIRIK
jgi:hypothetical protein